MRSLSCLVVALFTLFAAPAAHAEANTAAQRLWLEEIASKLEAEGFEVGARRIEERGYAIEVRYRDASSMRTEKAATDDARVARTAR
ncbi:MAG: hypothetical protein ABI457_04435 [Hyphomicrobium sp.]